ncbi:MAG: glycosyltransferase family 4 protein [Oscillospiraceae bacterium]|nr:glycosyltransferase family 4 protein [Oscillospiraceae bacterium]
MKKIAFVTTVSLTVRAFILPVVRYLRAHTDWELTIICDDDPQLSECLPEGVRYIPISMKRGISVTGIRSVLEMAKLFRKEKFDLVQYSTPNAAFYAAIASWSARIPNRKYHLMGFRYLGFSGAKKALFKCIEKLACSLSTDIECVSVSNLELGVAEGVFPRKKVSVLFHGSSAGVDLSRFDIAKKALWRAGSRARYGYEDENVVFGFAGRITGDKGINELLSAFDQLDVPDARLFIVGDIEDAASLDQAKMDQAKSDDKIIFHDHVTDIERYFAMMDVLVLPSYREGFGNIVIEAQAMGVPVIVSDIPGPTDAMLPGVTGLTVPVKDIPALKKAMEKMASDRSGREGMGKRGRLFVEERFDQRKLCAAILHDRKNLLKG